VVLGGVVWGKCGYVMGFKALLGVPLSHAPKAKGQAAHVTFLFSFLHQNTYIAVTIEIL